MSKIPYRSEKSALKAKKKFMKDLSKDKEAERIYLKESNLEMEILSYFEALDTEKDVELDDFEKIEKRTEIETNFEDDDAFGNNELEDHTESTVNALEEKTAADDADIMETTESGDFDR